MITTVFCFFILLFANVSIIFSKIFRKNKKIFYITFVAIFVRYLVLILNSDGYVTPGSHLDANSFHLNAEEKYSSISNEIGIGAFFYEYLLTLLYKVSEPSRVIGAQFSILFFTFAALGFCRIYAIIHNGRINALPYFIFMLLPSSILHTAITLRESLQLFGVIFLTYGVVISSKKINSFKGNVISVISGIFTAFLHHALFIFVFSAWLRSLYKSKINFFKLGLLAVFILLGFITMLNPPVALNRLINQGIIQAIIDYQGGAPELARTTYKHLIPNESAVDYFLIIPRSIFYYIIMPLPQYVSSPIDIYALFESFFRIYLIYFIIRYRQYTLREEEQKILWHLYLLMTVLWSVGTVNYGTAIRHHILDMWFLYILFIRPVDKKKFQ